MDITTEKEIAYVLKQIGIPQDIRGYNYIIYAVGLVLENKNMLNHVYKDIYPAVAEKFNTKAMRVERNMRHAITVGFDRIDPDITNYIFGNSISPDTGVPALGHFIAAIAETVRFIHVPTTHTSIDNASSVISNEFEEMFRKWKNGGDNNE